MADSNITKRALAAALKDLMEETPLAKISVADICSKCGMNRKSFYYHFRDKYDLVNWIFDVEFMTVVSKKPDARGKEFLEALCGYFYENRRFYRNALQVGGQNSFYEHFTEFTTALIAEHVKNIAETKELHSFYITFLADAFTASFYRWILDRDRMLPEEFVSRLWFVARVIAANTKETLPASGLLS